MQHHDPTAHDTGGIAVTASRPDDVSALTTGELHEVREPTYADFLADE